MKAEKVSCPRCKSAFATANSNGGCLICGYAIVNVDESMKEKNGKVYGWYKRDKG